VFSTSDPSRAAVKVPLNVAVGNSCIAVAPNAFNFGVVKKGCSSASRTFSIYNLCTESITLTGIEMQAAAGQMPGGIDCPGTTPCPEFILTSAPSIPASGITFVPGGDPYLVTTKYRPIDVGADTGIIAVRAIQAGQPVSYLVTLSGAADNVGLQTDNFNQSAKPKADILLTIDDSESMSDKQQALADNFASFFSYAISRQADFQLGVTTTDDDEERFVIDRIKPAGPRGKLLGSATAPKILTQSTPNLEALFKEKVLVGIKGSGWERGLATSTRALTPPLISNENAGFLRDDANLAIVVVTDARDQSQLPAATYYNILRNVKGIQRANMFTFNLIGPQRAIAPDGCKYDTSGKLSDAGRYEGLVHLTGGALGEICSTNWAQSLTALGQTVFGFRTIFFLNGTPDLATALDVRVDGKAVSSTDYQYDPASNSIQFTTTKTPQPGQNLTVTYRTMCF
jgi:hypothetical protein